MLFPVSAGKYIPNEIKCNVYSEMVMDRIRIARPILFILSKYMLKSHRGHRGHREKQHNSVLSVSSVVEKLLFNSIFEEKTKKISGGWNCPNLQHPPAPFLTSEYHTPLLLLLHRFRHVADAGGILLSRVRWEIYSK